MNNRVNYTLVGSLVLVAIMLMIALSYWMLKPDSVKNNQTYTIYFDESILGLNRDAPVKYRGINVGKVKYIGINAKNSEQVEVRISILKTTPIKTDTAAKLTAQGITGLTYINLSKGSHNSSPLKQEKGEKFCVIRSVPSFFTNFENSLGSVSSSLSSTLGRTEELLGKDNQEQMALLLKRSANVMQKIDLLLDDATIQHVHASAKNLDELTDKLNKLTPNVDKFLESSVAWEKDIAASFASITESYVGITASMDEIKRAVASGEFNFKDMGADVIPTMNNTFLEMQALMVKFEDMLEQYDKSPSDLLYKTQEIKKAPGEK